MLKLSTLLFENDQELNAAVDFCNSAGIEFTQNDQVLNFENSTDAINCGEYVEEFLAAQAAAQETVEWQTLVPKPELEWLLTTLLLANESEDFFEKHDGNPKVFVDMAFKLQKELDARKQ